MKQNVKTKKLGAEAFEEYYGTLFNERWPSLKQSLQKEVSHFFIDFGSGEKYFLDAASICAALCLPLKDAKEILDMCAAPGGKTLVLCGTKEADAHLCSNERSFARKTRLEKVVQSILPSQTALTVSVTCSDGATLCKKNQEIYDAVLLDAPCSSERHVLNDEKYLKLWSPARIKTLSMEQWALLSSAWRLLKKGGFLLYATCALSPLENDGCIDRLLKKFCDACVVDFKTASSFFENNLKNFSAVFGVENDDLCEAKTAAQRLSYIFSLAEKTQSGFHLLPDTAGGFGPLYFCLIQKK